MISHEIACIRHFTASLADHWVVKTLAALAAALLPPDVHDFAVTAFILVIFDTASGIVAAVVNKQKIESAKAARLLMKIFVYGVVAITASHIGSLVGERSALAKAALTWIAVTEGLSIVENLKYTGIPLPPWLSSRLKSLK